MKYLGKKSLSSVFSIILKIAWWAILIMASIAAILAILFMILPHIDHPEAAKAYAELSKEMAGDKDWQDFMKIPLPLRILIIPYLTVAVTFLLRGIKTAGKLFTNFKRDIVFHKDNVTILGKMSKMLLIFAIMTFDFNTITLCLVLLILSDVFKNGTKLQEEHDFTV